MVVGHDGRRMDMCHMMPKLGHRLWGNEKGSWDRTPRLIEGHIVCNCEPPQGIWREGSVCTHQGCGDRLCCRCLRCLSSPEYVWVPNPNYKKRTRKIEESREDQYTLFES
jgi:hypothetical protein